MKEAAMPEQQSPQETVRQFLRALEEHNGKKALSYLGDGVVYRNMPLPAARGAAAKAQIRAFMKLCTGFEARIHNIAAEGPMVLTERTDVLQAGRFRTSFWVCGTFEVRDGKIVYWCDYFDWFTVLAGSGVGGVRALVSVVADRRRSVRAAGK
jgi:limonene-1,2-epoxide hydrolase